MGALPLPQQAARHTRATGDLRSVSTALRLEPMVRFAGTVATESVGRADAAAVDPGKSERAGAVSRRSVRGQTTDDCEDGDLSVLVHRSCHQTSDRCVVATRGAW